MLQAYVHCDLQKTADSCWCECNGETQGTLSLLLLLGHTAAVTHACEEGHHNLGPTVPAPVAVLHQGNLIGGRQALTLCADPAAKLVKCARGLWSTACGIAMAM
jgi:hypothetical protein